MHPQAVADRGASDANNFISQLAPQTRAHEPGQDTFLSGAAHNSDFARGIRLTCGKIITSLPYVNWYLIQLDDARGNKPGFKLTVDSGVNPIGVRESSPLPPNSQVLVFESPATAYCGIIGVIPSMLTDSNMVNPDWISQGSNTGFRKEKYYWDLLQVLQKEGGINDFSDNRPNDSTSCAEWGRFSELGLGIYLDSFMTFIRTDEETGFYAFYHDQLARICGHNLDVRSSGHEIVARDDQGEFHYMHGDTPYPWESLGAYAYGETPFRETDDHDVMFKALEAKLEPQHDDQQAFYRYREWGGYMGQGRMREVLVPPKESGLQRYQDRDAASGVFREQISLTGHASWQAAKGFDLIKRSLIPVAKQVKLPESAEEDNADNETNYRSAGQEGLGAGREHKIKDMTSEGELPALMSAVGMQDHHAVVCNWYGLHPFAYHEKDYYLPEQSEVPQLTAIQRPLDFSSLKSNGWMDRPEPKQIKVDHRYGEVDYYENTAGIRVTDDGAVVIFDGYGGEIRLAGGNIQISCPGNVFLQPGRSLVALAGDDAIIRAQQSVDVTAGKKDLRLFARKNMQLLAKDGGVLVETQSSGTDQQYDGKIGEDVTSSAIVLKAGKSGVVTWSKDLYLRTGSQDGEIQSGDIVLDADKGQANIRSLSRKFERYSEESYLDHFGTDSIRATNAYLESRTALCSGLETLGRITSTEGGVFGGTLLVAGGHIATEQAASMSLPVVFPLQDEALAQVLDALQFVDLTAQSFNDMGNTDYQQVTRNYYESNKPGNGTVQKQTAFSLRNEKQYGTEGFKLPETRWQHLARESGGGTAWDEEPIDYQSTQLMPYPGKDIWEGDSMLTMTPKYFKPSDGLDEERGTGEQYEDPSYAEWKPLPLKTGYLTITE